MAKYYICNLSTDIIVLGEFNSYDAADDVIDDYCDRYPHAYIDILSKADLNSIPAI